MEKTKLVNPLTKDCCGCGLCASVCPTSAIEMTADACGYIYPNIDESKCIYCDKCRESCVMNAPHNYGLPIETYAGVRRDKERLKKSSSGGIFAAAAEQILRENGYVCGAAIEEDFSVRHRLIGDLDDLDPLLGSKYVQSDLTPVFGPIIDLLKENKMILFCGTPCQVDAVKRATGAWERLITMEVICSGVPNQKMFRSFINHIGKGNAAGFVFRDKSQGWSYNHCLTYKDGTKKRINNRLSSYMGLWGYLFRDSCYSCPYAQSARNADITVGDYWGIVKKRPDIAKTLDVDKGVSCVVVNTKKGAELLKRSDIDLFESNYDDISAGNGTLRQQSGVPDERQTVLGVWAGSCSWKDMDRYWRKKHYKFYYRLWALLPNWARQVVRVAAGVR